ncbi:hypothetical protein M5W98_30610, partial [Paenibacillus apiarius]|nr:hypothetical protein [Paenibacillus apiarius]
GGCGHAHGGLTRTSRQDRLAGDARGGVRRLGNQPGRDSIAHGGSVAREPARREAAPGSRPPRETGP